MGEGGAMAFASGVTAENVSGYLPYVNAFLVGTGIEAGFGVLDAAKLRALLAAVSAKEPSTPGALAVRGLPRRRGARARARLRLETLAAAARTGAIASLALHLG
jgi:hypothetical protein